MSTTNNYVLLFVNKQVIKNIVIDVFNCVCLQKYCGLVRLLFDGLMRIADKFIMGIFMFVNKQDKRRALFDACLVYHNWREYYFMISHIFTCKVTGTYVNRVIQLPQADIFIFPLSFFYNMNF